MNHVIEHVYEPERLLHRAFELLEPGGTLWMALPNPAALGLTLFGRGWIGLHLPFHLVIPSQKILRRWLRSAGFEHIKLIRRGSQSHGLWQESRRIAEREKVNYGATRYNFVRLAGDIISTITPRWGEETIIIALKPKNETN